MGDIVPKLSIVIAAHNGMEELCNCLVALETQRIPPNLVKNIEIIAAGHFSEATIGYVQKCHPTVRLVPSADPVSVPRLRSWGLREATGDIVALLEDHCIPGPDWLHTM